MTLVFKCVMFTSSQKWYRGRDIDFSNVRGDNSELAVQDILGNEMSVSSCKVRSLLMKWLRVWSMVDCSALLDKTVFIKVQMSSLMEQKQQKRGNWVMRRWLYLLSEWQHIFVFVFLITIDFRYFLATCYRHFIRTELYQLKDNL